MFANACPASLPGQCWFVEDPLVVDSPAASPAVQVIAYLLLGDPIPDADRAALYGRAQRLLPAVAHSGPWEALRQVVFSARRDALNAATGKDVRGAALTLLAAVGTPEIAEKLVGSAHHLGRLTADHDTLLQTAGAQAIWAIGRHLQSEPQSAITPALVSLSHGLGADVWRRVLVDCSARGAEDLVPLLSLMAGLPPPLARPGARALAEHSEPQVRRRASALLFSLTPYDPSTRQLLESRLLSVDPSDADIARAAVLLLDPPDLALLTLALSDTAGSPLPAALRQRLEDRRQAAGTTTS